MDESTARGAGLTLPADIPELHSFIAALPGLFLIVRADAPHYTIDAAGPAHDGTGA